MEARFLSQSMTCLTCDKPITDEKGAYTVRDEFDNLLGAVCGPCGEEEKLNSEEVRL
ncbi:MAG: hypothetical protein V3V32_05380 [Dehalococcoidia bacterium]